MLLENHLLHGLDLLNEAEYQQIAVRLGPDYSTLSAPFIEMRIRETTDQAPALFYIDIDAPQQGVVFRSTNLQDQTIPSVPGQSRYSSTIPGIGEVRAADFSMTPFTATIATPLQPVRNVMHSYVQICAGLLLAMLVMSLGIGLWLSKLVLAPIRLIRDTADGIRQDNLSRRIPVGDVHDEISDLARLLNQMFDRIESAFEQVRRFTSEASHELKTPLSLIRLNAEQMVRSPGMPPAFAEAVQFQLEEVARLTRIIEDLMFLSRADAQAIALELKPYDPAAFLDGFNQDATALAEHHGLVFEVTHAGAGVALFEPRWMRQVLLNVLVNAIHVSPTGGHIVLTSTLDNGSWRLGIKDEGPGLDLDQCEHMFERFVRFATPGKDVPGSGLGLAICRSIIALHGGRIFARPNLAGRGLRVLIEIPADAAA
ncbi:HAMP domain-containing sensor histidine kinase [Cupriavidus basilensis]|uniref:histidine kinase n=1 Tax=Cupriavidus basilensis TaxID=68895 RepID=A0ABT6B4D0_9BURK|nr:HAMP domain-containing sensor histidine kinase [Cupriavidus basilensis]MDF3839738.1 HAMP domain-containing sensor histidine kinase [Cupriavidus basilensis]